MLFRSAIKNIGTSGLLNVNEFSEPNTDPASRNPKRDYNGNGSVNYPNYVIYGNNGCLQFDNTQSPSIYNFQACNANDSRQRFNMTQITSLDTYNGKITDPGNQSYRINSTDNTILGFYVVNPETDSNQCLTINNDGLSVIPCNLDSSQRFKPYYHSIYP